MDDMPMPDGAPWLDMPIMLHSSRESECDMTPEQCAYKTSHWRNWYIADLVYAHNTIYFGIAMILFFTIARALPSILPKTLQRTVAYRKAVSASRYLSYRSYHFAPLRWYTAPLGLLLLLAASAVFFFGMTLGPKPYYWPKLADGESYGDSQPIATRAGWMALALLPFVLVLPTKMNFVTALTGVPHEKLQFFHQWSAWIMFVLALVHTFPFIIYSISQGMMVMNWRTSVFYWTGVVALLAQAWLTVFSIGFLRRRYYELFKATHLLAALIFVLIFFFHCDFTLTSVDYFIAAAVLYWSSWLLSALRTLYEHGVKRARVSVLANDTVRIAIPSTSEWLPGQHAFLRFPTLGIHHAWTSHPFTICSLEDSDEMVFYIKPHHGLTARLHTVCAARPETSLTVLLDGPYGGVSPSKLTTSDKALIVAGGSGAGFVLPMVEHVLRQRCLEPATATQLHIVLATRKAETVAWFRGQLCAMFARYKAYEPGSGVPEVAIHLTDGNGLPVDEASLYHDEDNDSDEKKDSRVASDPDADAWLPSISTHRGRPALAAIVSREASQLVAGRLCVVACGPASMLHDVRNAAAGVQARLVAGEGAGCRELYLHTEHFGL